MKVIKKLIKLKANNEVQKIERWNSSVPTKYTGTMLLIIISYSPKLNIIFAIGIHRVKLYRY